MSSVVVLDKIPYSMCYAHTMNSYDNSIQYDIQWCSASFTPPPIGLVFCPILEIFGIPPFFDLIVPNPRSFSLERPPTPPSQGGVRKANYNFFGFIFLNVSDEEQ